VTGVAGYVPFVLGALAFMSAVLPTALTSSPQPKPLTASRIDLGLLYKTSPIAVIAAFCIGMAGGTFGTLAPVYGFKLGLDPTTISFMVSVAAVAGAVAQIPFGRLSDIIDRRLVLAGASLCAALVGIAFILLDPHQEWLLYILFGLYGLSALSLYAIAVAHANDHAKEGEFAKVASGMLLILGIGQAIGPIAGSYAMNVIGPVGLFTVTASFHGALALIAFLRMHMRDALPAEDRAPFQAMPLARHSTPETYALDPRTEASPLENETDTTENDAADANG
jgi:MFS family permease